MLCDFFSCHIALARSSHLMLMRVMKAKALPCPLLRGKQSFTIEYDFSSFLGVCVCVCVCVCLVIFFPHSFDNPGFLLGRRLGIKCRMSGDRGRHFHFICNVFNLSRKPFKPVYLLRLVRPKSNFNFIIVLVLFFPKILFIFRERGREGKREGEKHQSVVASCAPPTGDLGMCPDWGLNQQATLWFTG